jgi:hypothetical protein
MIRCDAARVAMLDWPEEAEKADVLALHMDGCASCRRAFDEAFPVWREGDRLPVLPGVSERLSPSRPAWRPVGLLAAVVLFGLGAMLAQTVSAPGPETVFDPWLTPPECPVQLAKLELPPVCEVEPL